MFQQIAVKRYASTDFFSFCCKSMKWTLARREDTYAVVLQHGSDARAFLRRHTAPEHNHPHVFANPDAKYCVQMDAPCATSHCICRQPQCTVLSPVTPSPVDCQFMTCHACPYTWRCILAHALLHSTCHTRLPEVGSNRENKNGFHEKYRYTFCCCAVVHTCFGLP